MADIGELVIRIKADAAQLEREMRKANQTVEQNANRMQRSIKGLAEQFRGLVPALSVAAIASFGATAFREADHINDLAQRVGFLGSTLSALNIPLKQSGSSLDEFTGSMVRMNNAIADGDQSKESVKVFDQLGLSIRKLEQLRPEEQFFAIADSLSQVKSQSEFTNLGIAIFGRSFATIAPLIRQAGGDMESFTQKIKDNGDALSDDELARIDEFGDKWTESVEKLKLAMLNAMPAIQLYADGLAGILNLPTNAFNAGQQLARASGLAGNPNVSSTRPNVPSDEELAAGVRASISGKGSASGSNAGLIKDTKLDNARKQLADYNRELQRQYEILQLTPREQAAVKAGYDTLDLAQKAGVKNSEELVEANMQLARSNYDMQEAMQESARFAQELKDKFSGALSDIVFDFDNAGDAAKRFFETIARAAIEKKITGPLMDSLLGASSGGVGLLGSMFGGFFADGGRPPLGKASIVGENGPELFIPDTAGTIVPNGSSGGGGVSVTNVWNIASGVSKQEVMALIPIIEAKSTASVFRAIERGGSASQAVGRRS